MSNSGHEGTRIRRDLGSVGFRLWRRFGYCRTGHNHGSANHDYDSSYYDGGSYYHGERVRWRSECPREGGVLFVALVVFS